MQILPLFFLKSANFDQILLLLINLILIQQEVNQKLFMFVLMRVQVKSLFYITRK